MLELTYRIGGILKKILVVAASISLAFANTLPVKAETSSSYESLKFSATNELLSVQADGSVLSLIPILVKDEVELFSNYGGQLAFLEKTPITNSETPILATLTSSDQVELVWDFKSDVSTSIFRDGVPLGEYSSSGYLVDENFDPLTHHEYVLTATNSSEEISEAGLDASQIMILGAEVWLPPLTGISSLSSAAESLPDYTILRYVTFIKDKYVPTPIVGCLPFGSDFLGNDRDFNPFATASQSKTILTVRVDWDSQLIRFWRYVGPTVMVTPIPLLGGYFESFWDQAPETGLWVALTRATLSTSAEFKMHVSAANPSCLAYPIYADLDVLLKRNGNYYMHGLVRFVPHHEFYKYENDTDQWTLIYRRAMVSQGFDCFSPVGSATYTTQCLDNLTFRTDGVVTLG